jgi:hypothetical protein
MNLSQAMQAVERHGVRIETYHGHYRSWREGHSFLVEAMEVLWQEAKRGSNGASQDATERIAAIALKLLLDQGKHGCICCADQTCDRHPNQDQAGDYA